MHIFKNPIGFLFLVLTYFISSCDGKKNSLSAGGAGRNVKIPVEVMVVESKLLIDEIFTTGSLLPNERVELRNEIAGRITGIYFEEGSYVTKGKLLLKINDSELRAQLNKIEAQVSLIEQEVYRKQKLLDIRAISQEEYDIADIQLKSFKAEKELVLAQIAKTEVYAPFNGKIGLRHVSPGSYQAPNSIIASLQQIDQVKIEFSVPEKYSRVIKPGMSISFTVENSSNNFEGKVYAVESSVDPQTRTITARALTNNKSGFLVPGTFARVSLVLNRIPDALMVPSEALNTEIDGVFVYLYKNGKANSVPVKTGLRTPSEIQIIEGLQDGDTLIVTGLLQISNETPVDPKLVSGLVLNNDKN